MDASAGFPGAMPQSDSSLGSFYLWLQNGPGLVLGTSLGNYIWCLFPQVDTWSAGVMFFQLLFSKVPFAADKHQDLVFREGTIPQEARNLHFPEGPLVSEACKDYIKRCVHSPPMAPLQ